MKYGTSQEISYTEDRVTSIEMNVTTIGRYIYQRSCYLDGTGISSRTDVLIYKCQSLVRVYHSA